MLYSHVFFYLIIMLYSIRLSYIYTFPNNHQIRSMCETARRMGLRVCGVAALGDCMPEAIAEAITIRKNNEELNHYIVRKVCVDWLRPNASFRYEGQPLSAFLDNERDSSWEVSRLYPYP